jgi:serine/threonine protein kinase
LPQFFFPFFLFIFIFFSLKVDFGTARFITEELNHVGTYFPPERNEKMPSFFRNKAFLKSDIWNLGLVMYELMFSNGQFDKKRLYNFYLNEGNKKIEIPENNYSDDLIKLINKMLEFV